MTASRCTVASRSLFVLARCSYRGSSGIYSSLLAPDRVSSRRLKPANAGRADFDDLSCDQLGERVIAVKPD
jgi:hypothetical protein